MARLGFRQLACYLLTAVWSLSTHGQDVADKPDLQLGDEWVFVQTGEENGKPVNRQWRRKIVEMLPDETFRVFPKYYGYDVFDRSWNVRLPEQPNSWPIDFQFPLKVGASWSFASPAGAMNTNGNLYDMHGQHKVVAIESIKVPAGRFMCYRIEGKDAWVVAHGGGNADYKNVEQWVMTRWYCPAIKYVAKMHTVRLVTSSGVKREHSELDSELLEFKPAEPIAAVLETSATPTDPRSPELASGSYDGDWSVSLECVAIEEFPAAAYQWRVRVRGGEFVLQAGSPGRPGYWRIAGRPSADGTLALVGTGISPAQAALGREYVADLRGQKSGAQFVLEGFFGARKCAMTLARAAAIGQR